MSRDPRLDPTPGIRGYVRPPGSVYSFRGGQDVTLRVGKVQGRFRRERSVPKSPTPWLELAS